MSSQLSSVSDFPSEPVERRDQLRRWEKDLSDTLGPTPPDLEEIYTTAPLPGRRTSELKVVRPKKAADGPFPLIVLFHGGAFTAGTVEQVTRPARDFACRYHAVVVAPTYRFAPEHPFPAGIEDAWAALVWLAENAGSQFEAKPDRGFVLGGFSAGGNFAAVLSAIAVERGLKPGLTGVFISLPLLLVEEIVPEKYRNEWTSRVDNVNDPMFGG